MTISTSKRKLVLGMVLGCILLISAASCTAHHGGDIHQAADATTIANTNKYLQPISGGEVVLKACDGKQTIAKDGKSVFTGWIDRDFVHYGANEPGPATPETPVTVYELVKDASFARMFGSLSNDNDKLVLTQAQILEFVRDHENLLRTDGYATFFLFKSNGKFFVARVRGDVAGLGADVRHFEYDYTWFARFGHRVVVPQLAP
jgi:hypothetical protein